ncbi:hypothetical protein LSS_03559 [Leptospira santarosai serovar Shermani str. LT 821]|uniref:Uncharacterized protein n=1 Tax=Leptospira santarosai serovar Shermani str. LT 821 TaxID=758847 RepID=K8YFA1_9LEPT|nr:hypothetical protein LSS_03559 [Leptospira santarosai serovar Shermani str. LT 821]
MKVSPGIPFFDFPCSILQPDFRNDKIGIFLKLIAD